QAAVGPAHAATAELTTEERDLSAARGDAQRAALATERDHLESEHTLRGAAERVQALLTEIETEDMHILDDGTVQPRNPIARLSAPIEGELDDDDDAFEAIGAGSGMRSPLRGGADVDVIEMRRRVTELRGQIRSLGPVNVEALEDLSAEQERHDFLVGQVADL